MGGRRRARGQTLQVLCLLDTQPDLAPAAGAELYRQHLLQTADAAAPDQDQDEDKDDGEEAKGVVAPFAEGMIRGVRENLPRLDELISKASRNWRLTRMTWVDRNILRIAAYELLLCPDVPVKVAINEAIELAKRFGTSESSAFVNGVLDRLMSDLGRPCDTGQ